MVKSRSHRRIVEGISPKCRVKITVGKLGCAICGNPEPSIPFKGMMICTDCLELVKQSV